MKKTIGCAVYDTLVRGIGLSHRRAMQIAECVMWFVRGE